MVLEAHSLFLSLSLSISNSIDFRSSSKQTWWECFFLFILLHFRHLDMFHVEFSFSSFYFLNLITETIHIYVSIDIEEWKGNERKWSSHCKACWLQVHRCLRCLRYLFYYWVGKVKSTDNDFIYFWWARNAAKNIIIVCLLNAFKRYF